MELWHASVAAEVSTLWPVPKSHLGSVHGFFLLFILSKSYGKQLFSMGYQCRTYCLNNLLKIDLFSYILRSPIWFGKPKRAGADVPLFSALFDLSLKVLTLNQVRRSLFVSIKFCFPWALLAHRLSLDTPSLGCPQDPPQDWGGHPMGVCLWGMPGVVSLAPSALGIPVVWHDSVGAPD